MRKLFFVAAFIFSAARLHGQFQMLAVTNDNVCTWKVRNTSTDTIQLISVSLRLFHQKPDMDFTPRVITGGVSKYQYQGNFKGKTRSFKYKTIQIISLDSILDPGLETVMATGTNAGNIPDTIMAAGAMVYYKIKNGPVQSVNVYPGGVNPCPSEAVFINAGIQNWGIKYGSYAGQNVHSSNCSTQLVAVVYDRDTLKRKAVTGILPKCAGGRAWTTFGNPTDNQVYYSFDISTAAGRSAFDSLAEAMQTGDFIALVNQNYQRLTEYAACNNTLAKLGISALPQDTTFGFVCMVGRKGAQSPSGHTDYCISSHGNCAASMEHSLIGGSPYNTIYDFGECYETLVQTLTKAPAQSLTTTTLPAVQIFPNPTDQIWNIRISAQKAQLKLYDAGMRKVMELTCGNQASIATSQLAKGNYILEVSTSAGTSAHHLIRR
ncbi:MAG: T9SS type A sorting domain-containing protein [Bacteroidetes bacterium]|nr:T9SS type A sorting domain-containing protein [Bacteroidota bacterium]